MGRLPVFASFALLLSAVPGCFDFNLGGSSSSSTSSGGTACQAQPAAACPIDHECLARTDNAKMSRYGLAVDGINLTTPPSLVAGVGNFLLDVSFEPDEPECNTGGGETSRWLLVFDDANKTLTFGGATKAIDGRIGFEERDVQQGGEKLHVGPVTFDTTVVSGELETTAKKDVVLPVVIDTSKPDMILPLHGVRLTGVKLSASHNCIGSFDTGVLAAQSGCGGISFPNNPLGRGAHVQGFITLEEADAVVIDFASQTLCAALANYPVIASGPITKCARENGVFTDRGDWCSATDAPATTDCADAFRIAADFGARAVPFSD